MQEVMRRRVLAALDRELSLFSGKGITRSGRGMGTKPRFNAIFNGFLGGRNES